ncbi:MAG: hypothetical protein IMY73_05395 [Bacteroidetes bacterium]|nr:hypothetical protein [Bacteroidota bacterium]
MENDKKEYFNNYIEKLTSRLIEQCSSKGFLNGGVYEIEELDEKWKLFAPEYMADAVPQIPDYPLVSIAWAGYIGMGAVVMWDKSWDKFKDAESIYKLMRDPRGFDCMDEHITEDMLGLNLESKEATDIENLWRGCAQTALDMLRKENIEPQSVDAFHIYSYTVKVFYKLGISIELKRLKYKYVKVNVPIEDPKIN